MWFFTEFFRKKALKGYLRDAQKIVSIISSLKASELVEIKASVALALAFILEDLKEQENQSFLKALHSMHEDIVLNKRDFADLCFYNARLINLQREAFISKSIVNKMIAAGIPIWITSIRAVICPEIIPYAIKIWSFIEQTDNLSFSEKILDLAELPEIEYLGEGFARMTMLETPPLFQNN